MTPLVCLLLIGAALLVIAGLLLKQAFLRNALLAAEPIVRDDFPNGATDGLALEIGDRIFDSEDWRLVANEASRPFVNRFRAERTILALDWLRAVRGQVRRVVRGHRRGARAGSNVRVVDELRLAWEWLLFEAMAGVLFCVMLVRGPWHTAGLLGWSLDSARNVRRIAREALPRASRGMVGAVKSNS